MIVKVAITRERADLSFLTSIFNVQMNAMNKKQQHIRKSWIQATRFHPLTDAEVRTQVVQKVRETREEPVVIFDLDSTLYEVGPRTFKILKEWSQSAQAGQHDVLARRLKDLDLNHVGYSLKDTFQSLGVSLEDSQMIESLRAAKQFWLTRFFSNDYLTHDRPYEGAARYVSEVFQAGARLVYLTGRDEPGMGRGTREKLKADGFPINDPRIHFFLKPQREGDDELHKAQASHDIRKLGNVVASFENEPRNVITLSQAIPQAMHIFLDTVCSDHPAEPGDGLYILRKFD